MINAISNALSGLSLASKKAETAATNIAQVSVPEAKVDLAEEAVNLKIAEISFKANAAVLRTIQETSEDLLHTFDIEV